MSDAFQDFAALVPGIIGNPFVPHFPHPRQSVLLGAHLHAPRDEVFEALYGGAAGGGKSDALLMAAAQYLEFPHFRGLILRKTFAEMRKSGAIMERAVRWWANLPGVTWNRSDYVFTFPSGATVEFGYHDHPDDDTKYQGGEWHFVAFDELTHWPDLAAWEWLKTRIRKAEGDTIPLRLLATSNPGGKGHVPVKLYFLGGTDPETGERIEPRARFIGARIEDNPSLDRATYIRTLEGIHPTKRKQLLEGDWDARDPGDYFRPEWFGPLLDLERDPVPRGSIAVRWWDLAASESKDAARTAGVRMVRFPTGARAVVHAVAFRKTPGARDAAIVRQAEIDGPATTIGLEIEGGSGGISQFDGLRDRLTARGFRVVGARPRAPMTDAESERIVRANTDRAKEARADPVASCLERGHQRRGECLQTGEPWWGLDIDLGYAHQRDGIRLYSGTWTQGYLDELEGFPDYALKDLVDATSGAYAYLEAHRGGFRTPPAQDTPAHAKPVHPHDRHPEDEPDDPGRDRGGRWRP